MPILTEDEKTREAATVLYFPKFCSSKGF